MSTDDIPDDSHPAYDIRSRPKRGVRVKALPKHVHREFKEFCDGLRAHAQSHLGTIYLAKSSSENYWVTCQIVYWKNALKYINTIEYLGTANAKRH